MQVHRHMCRKAWMQMMTIDEEKNLHHLLKRSQPYHQIGFHMIDGSSYVLI